MLITSKAHMDNQGRVCVAPLFNETPRKVTILYRDGEKKIELGEAEKLPKNFPNSLVIPLDAKNRVVIPKWLRTEFNTSEWYLGIDEKGNRFLFPKKD